MIRTHIRFPGGITVERVEPRLSSPGDPYAGELRHRDATAEEIATYRRMRYYLDVSGPEAASMAVQEMDERGE